MANKLKLITNRNGYCYKYGPIYLGWIVKHVKSDESISYFDNTPTMTMYKRKTVEHLVAGFTKKEVIGKLSKYLDREKSETVTEPAQSGESRQNGPDVIYICDGCGCASRKCAEVGFDFCRHTTDISHAANFEYLGDGKYAEKDRDKSYQDGYDVGVARGYEAGHRDGYAAGKEDGGKHIKWWN